MNKPFFRGRAFVTMLMLCGFIIVALSGIVLYVAPHGRPSDWRFLALSKHDWAEIHTVFGLLFPLMAAIHVGYNWKPLVGYFRTRIAERSLERLPGFLRLELLVAILVCVSLGVMTLGSVSPVSTLRGLRSVLTDDDQEGGIRARRGVPFRERENINPKSETSR